MLKIGHRGAAGYAPENTLYSFEKAMKMGVDMIEFDVRPCATGEIVIIHDSKVNRTTDGKGYVSDLSFGEIKRLRIEKRYSVPLLSEALEFINGKVSVNIEIKEEGIAEKVFKIVNDFISSGIYDDSHFLISSFYPSELKSFKKQNDEIPLGILSKKVSKRLVENIKELEPRAVNLNHKIVNGDIVEKIHSLGKKLYVWTVDTAEEILELKALDVDGIFSNFPDRL